ncbi:MAG TPA: hypothetical protein VK667_14470, partial [Ktedonobacteraceae bacterium]|nr:hypothetical protein [Ktedonobacteraceae bacterium]
AVCEQVFRVLLDQEYVRARRLLEIHSELLPDPADIEQFDAASSLVGAPNDLQEPPSVHHG